MSHHHLPRGGTALANAVKELYRQGQTDYSLEPLLLTDAQGSPVGRVQDGDAVVFAVAAANEVQLTEAFVDRVLSGIEKRYDLIVTNFANGDVIGHTSNRDAKLQCAGLVDTRLGQVVNAAISGGYVVLVTADHGNLEEMTNGDGTSNTSHTTNPVPFLLVDPRPGSLATLRAGRLADIAPTILGALGLPQPGAMDGASLAPDYDWGGRRQVLLVILAGWGIGKQDDSNPIFLAPTPAWDDLTQRFPCTLLQAAGDAVGLQVGKAGNSEAGHMNIGAGRVVLQDDVRLDLAMKDGSFYINETLCRVIDQVKRRNTNLHLIGLLTEKSSHGSIDYPLAMLRMARANGLPRVYVHLIFDGRSTAPGSAPALLEKLERQTQEIGAGQIVTGMWRALALDRDGNYGKTQCAYDALVSGVGKYYAESGKKEQIHAPRLHEHCHFRYGWHARRCHLRR